MRRAGKCDQYRKVGALATLANPVKRGPGLALTRFGFCKSAHLQPNNGDL